MLILIDDINLPYGKEEEGIVAVLKKVLEEGVLACWMGARKDKGKEGDRRVKNVGLGGLVTAIFTSGEDVARGDCDNYGVLAMLESKTQRFILQEYQ